MKTSLKILAVFFAITASYAQNKSLKNSKPNIILVMTDDQGMGDLSCMGNQVVKTPNIDAFYKQSTRFTEFHVSPTCAPTRSAIMSGKHEFGVGVTHTILQRERMALNVFTMPQALQSAGYQTGIFGKWHLGDEEAYLPNNRGFNEVLIHGGGGIGQVKYGDFPPNSENEYFDNVLLHNQTIVKTKGFCTDLFFDAALAWTKKKIASKNPYFTYIALNAPHAPLIAPENYKKRFLDMGYDDGTAGRYGMIENIDDNFGRMIAYLKKWNALDNTLIIFMTDNGATHLSGTLNGEKVTHFNANLKGGKNSPYEGGSHVPAFWSWKGVLGEGVDINGIVGHIDLYKTFTELAGAKLPSKMQQIDGKSLIPLLENAKAPWDDRLFYIHCGRWKTGEQNQAKFSSMAVRTQKWSFVNNNQLYDIENDPSETQNLINQHPEIVANYQKQYDKWWEATLPLMVNEGLPNVTDHPLHLRYFKQLKEKGIPDWCPEKL
jgi:arylsulfatase